MPIFNFGKKKDVVEKKEIPQLTPLEASQLQITKALNLPGKKGIAPLHKAVEHDQKKVFDDSVKDKDIIIDVEDRYGCTPLHFAAGKADIHYVTKLLEHGANVNKQNKSAETPLHYAARAGAFENAKVLIENGATVNIKRGKTTSENTEYGESTPLHNACRASKLNNELIKLLLEKKADVNVVNQAGHTPLELLVKNSKVDKVSDEVFNQILENTNPKIITNKHLSILHEAARNQALSAERFKAILDAYKHFLNDHTFGLTPLSYAVQEKNSARIDVLLAAGANPNLGTDKPLFLACQIGDVPIIEKLLDAKANVNEEDAEKKRPINYVAKRGNVAAIEVMIKHGVDLSGEHGKKAVEVTLLHNNIPALIKLIEGGASPKVHVEPLQSVKYTKTESSFGSFASTSKRPLKTSNSNYLQKGDTPMHFAVATNHTELAAACLQQDPSVANAENAKKNSPALLAVKTLNLPMAQMMGSNNPEIQIVHEHKSLVGQGATRGLSPHDVPKFFYDESFKLSAEQEEMKEKLAREQYRDTYILDGVDYEKIKAEEIEAQNKKELKQEKQEQVLRIKS